MSTTKGSKGGTMKNVTTSFSKPNLKDSITSIISKRQDELLEIGLSQTDLAKEMNVSQQTLSKYRRFGEEMLSKKPPDYLIRLYKVHRFSQDEAERLAALKTPLG